MLLRCDSITPLGRPVVPLVKRMTNGSSSSSSTSGNGASGAYASSAAKSSSNDSTGRSSGRSTPSSRSSRRRSPSSTFGSVSSTAYAISSPVHQPLRPDGHAAERDRRPERRARTRPCSGATIATRSPGPTPYWSRSAAATAAIGWRIDANVYSRSGKIT